MNAPGAPAPDLPGIGEMIVSALTADEYRAMFDLREDDLRGPFSAAPATSARPCGRPAARR